MIVLRIIFALFLAMITRTAWLLYKGKKKEHGFVKRIKKKGGKPMGKHFNGRFYVR